MNEPGSAATRPPVVFHLAQYNVATLVAPLEDPRLADFVSELDRINTLGDRSAGFVWRLKTEDGTSTSVRVGDDERVLVNFTVWESIEALFEYTYHSDHADVFRKRRQWFEAPSQAYLVLWWIPAGHTPSLEEAEERLGRLRKHGPAPDAFTIKQRFDPPRAATAPVDHPLSGERGYRAAGT